MGNGVIAKPGHTIIILGAICAGDNNIPVERGMSTNVRPFSIDLLLRIFD